MVVLSLRFSSLRLIACQACDSTANGAADTILQALAKIRHLTLRLLGLALLVLADTLLLQALGADETADSLFGGTGILVP